MRKYKKLNLKRLQFIYLHLWIRPYIYNVISYDFIYKFQKLNIHDLLFICKKNTTMLSMDVSDNLSNLYEVSDSLSILSKLSKQNAQITSNYKCNISLNNFYFFNMFICYLYPIICKRHSAFSAEQIFQNKSKQYFFSEFHLYLDSNYDFLENKIISYDFNFNLSSFDNLKIPFVLYFLNYFNLHNE